MTHVLIVDDDPGFTPAIAEFVEQEGFTVSTACTLREARAELSATQPDLLLADMILPDGTGLELLQDPDLADATQVVIMTAHPTIDTAVESLRAKVSDFLIKPLDLQRLKACLGTIRSNLVPEEAATRLGAAKPSAPTYLIGSSPEMSHVYELIEKVAPTDATVFLSGESGTGKELAAKAIHASSARHERPFLAINCGAVAAELIGTELFGHERGSFTGANRQHRGYFERAQGGTLFLDEVTEMPLDLQVNLLRVLETGTLIRIGGDREVPVDVRLIAASNRDVGETVTQGKLREDLYFRLMVFPVQLPPLRSRAGDISLLAEHFLALLNTQDNAGKRFTSSTIEFLKQQPWPGNVRELRNAVQRAFILAGDKIEPEHFVPTKPLRERDEDGSLRFAIGTSIDEAERHMITATLEHFQGDKRRTAAALGISLKTLYNKLKQYQDTFGPC